MTSILIQQWHLAYAVIAVLFAMIAIVAAHHLQVGEAPSMAAEGTAALIAGALWPVMIVGLAQLCAIHSLVSRRSATHPAESEVAAKELVAAQ